MSSKWANEKNRSVATNDIGFTVKLKARGIAVLPLPETLRLPDEPDPLETENTELRRRLMRLEARMPILTVTYGDGAGHCRIKLTSIPATTGAPTVEQMRQKHTLLPVPQNRDTAGLQGTYSKGDLRIIAHKSAIDRALSYNEELELYFRLYEEYLHKLAAWQEVIFLQEHFSLAIKNNGTARASHIDLDLFFPEDILPISQSDIPEKPKAPTELVRPGRLRASDHLMRMGGRVSPFEYKLDSPIRTNYDGVPVTNESRGSAHITYSSLKHGYEVITEPIMFRFLSKDRVRSFCIDYTLSADELPDPVEGKLHVRIEHDLQ